MLMKNHIGDSAEMDKNYSSGGGGAKYLELGDLRHKKSFQGKYFGQVLTKTWNGWH